MTFDARTKIGAGLAAGVAMLATPVVMYFEGYRLSSYRDPIGIVTDCVGHTKTARANTVSTHAGCAKKLRSDMEEHWVGIAACSPVAAISEEEGAAYLSFAFNVGVGKFCGSTLAQLLRDGKRHEACAQLSRWVYAGGNTLPGLVTRRAAERELCELGLDSPRPPMVGVQG